MLFIFRANRDWRSREVRQNNTSADDREIPATTPGFFVFHIRGFRDEALVAAGAAPVWALSLAADWPTMASQESQPCG
jgi:hypothetical protein